MNNKCRKTSVKPLKEWVCQFMAWAKCPSTESSWTQIQIFSGQLFKLSLTSCSNQPMISACWSILSMNSSAKNDLIGITLSAKKLWLISSISKIIAWRIKKLFFIKFKFNFTESSERPYLFSNPLEISRPFGFRKIIFWISESMVAPSSNTLQLHVVWLKSPKPSKNK